MNNTFAAFHSRSVAYPKRSSHGILRKSLDTQSFGDYEKILNLIFPGVELNRSCRLVRQPRSQLNRTKAAQELP